MEKINKWWNKWYNSDTLDRLVIVEKLPFVKNVIELLSIKELSTTQKKQMIAQDLNMFFEDCIEFCESRKRNKNDASTRLPPVR